MNKFKLIMGWSLAFSSLYAGESTYTVSFKEGDVSLHKYNHYDVISLKGCESTNEIGKPMLPEYIVNILIPSNSVISDVSVDYIQKHELPGEYYIFPVQPMRPISYRVTIPFVSPDTSIYNSYFPYPSQVVVLSHVGKISGYKIASIAVHPIQYISKEKKLIFYSTIRFKVYYEEKGEKILSLTSKQKQIFSKIVGNLVINPQDISRFSPFSNGKAKGSEYIIITSSEFAPYFQPLADWKTQRGIPAEVVTTQWIYSNYSGRDKAEKIRNFIKDAHSAGAVWILLGGQCDYENGHEVVPRRDVYFWTCGLGYYTDEDTIPSDLYFAGLDGTWDGDSDGIFGEKEDNVDMYADIFVGRAPVRTISQVQNFVNKVITYENRGSILLKVSLPAEKLFSSPDWWGDIVNNAISNITPLPWEDVKLYESNGTLSKSAVRACINNGIGFIHYAGHGREDRISLGDEIFTSDDVSSLSNEYKLGVHISIACFTGAIDEVSGGDCFVEHLINNPNGGAIGVIMNSRYGWGEYFSGSYRMGPNEKIDTTFFHTIFKEDVKDFGIALSIAKNRWVKMVSNNYYRWAIYELSLFGDPEMPLWIAPQGGIALTEGPMDISPALMDIDGDSRQEVFLVSDDGDGDGNGKAYAYTADWNLMWRQDSQEDIQVESGSYRASIKIAKERLSIGILAGIYYPNRSVIYVPHRVTLPPTMWKIGLTSYYRFSKITFSMLLSYSYTENLNYLTIALGPPPFLNLNFRLCNLSFLCTFQRKFFGYIEGYAGGGIAFLNVNFSYLRNIGYDFYEYEKEVKNVTYLSSLIAGGLLLDIGTHWYMGIQGEMFVSHFIKWGPNEMNLKEKLPSLTFNVGYKLNLERRKP